MMLLATMLLVTMDGASPERSAGPDTTFVRVDVRWAQASVQPGGGAIIEVLFTPADDIHINGDPPVRVVIGTPGACVIQGAPRTAVHEKTGFLDSAVPVRQAVVFADSLPTGEAVVNGDVVYYYCSDAEGWCRRAVREFSLPVRIVPATRSDPPKQAR
jgi:hypothetical protein